MKRAGLDMDNCNYRERKFDDYLPWSHLDMGLRNGYLEQEWQRAVMKRIHRLVWKGVSAVACVSDSRNK